MLLAIDIGNTHTVIGVYAGDSLRAMWRIATNRKAAADELRIVFSTLFSLEELAGWETRMAEATGTPHRQAMASRQSYTSRHTAIMAVEM